MFLSILATAALSQAAAPPNDAFANALEIPSLTGAVASAEGTTAFATYEEEEPLHLGVAGQGSIWFTWVAPWSGDILFTMESSQPIGFIVVYSGATLTDLTPLTAPYSTVASVVEGQRYYIVANFTQESQDSIRVSVYSPPVNDSFANALPLSGLAGTFAGSNISAGSEQGEPLPRSMPPEMWPIQMLTNSCWQPKYIPVQAGEAIQIQADGANRGEGAFTIELLLYTAPTNDAFAQSLRIEGADLTIAGNNFAATLGNPCRLRVAGAAPRGIRGLHRREGGQRLPVVHP